MDAITDAIEALLERGRPAERDGRSIRLLQPTAGDPGSAVLDVLALAQDAAPIGASARGADGVAVAVWCPPNVYVGRWSSAMRWVVDYRLPASTKLASYIRAEGRLPTHLEQDRWNQDVPDEVQAAFREVGIDLDDPPFPPPPKPAPKPAPARTSARSSTGADGKAPAAPRARAPRKAAAPKPPPKPTAKLCPECHMQKAFSQFVPDSELCADCR